MNRVSKIALAAALTAGLATTPAMAVETTARDFVAGLSSDFAAGDLTSVQVKLNQLSQQGFEGIKVDIKMVTLARLMTLLGDVRQGGLDGVRVAASLDKLLQTSVKLRFIFGDVQVNTVDIGGGGGGAQFPAGSAA